MISEDELRSRRKPDRELSPGSIVYLAKSANVFLGEISDDAPITSIARTDLDSSRRHALVELIGEGWQGIGATDVQMTNIRSLFRSLLFNARDVDTMGKLREACRPESGRIARIPGLGVTAQIFLEVGTRKHVQTLQSGVRARGSLVSSSL